MLSEAEKIKGRDPIKARLLCRQVVKLYAGSNPTSPMVQRAIRLQNSIPSKDEDED